MRLELIGMDGVNIVIESKVKANNFVSTYFRFMSALTFAD